MSSINSPSPDIQRQASSRSSISSIRTTSARALRLTLPAPSTLALPTVISVSASSASGRGSPSLIVPATEDHQTSSFFMRSALQKDNNTIQAKQAELERNRARGNGKRKGKGRDRTWITSEFGGEGGGEAGIFLGKRRLIESPLEEVSTKQDQDEALAIVSTSAPPPSTITPILVSPSIASSPDASQETKSEVGPTQTICSPKAASVPARQHSWFPWPSSSQNVPLSDPVSASKGSDMTGPKASLTSSSSSSSHLVPSTEPNSSQSSVTARISSSGASLTTAECVPTTDSTQLAIQQLSPETANSRAWLHSSRLSQLQIPAILRSVSLKGDGSHIDTVSYGESADNSSGDAETSVPSETNVKANQEEEPILLTTEANASKGRWIWSYKNGSAHQPSLPPDTQASADLPQSPKDSDFKTTEAVVPEDVDQNSSSQDVSLPASEVRYSEWWSYLGYGPTRSTPVIARGEVSLPEGMTEQPSAPPDVLTSVVVPTSSYLNPISWVWPSSAATPVPVPRSMPAIPSGDIALNPSSEIPAPEILPPTPSAPPVTTSLSVPLTLQTGTTPVSLAAPTSVSYSSWLSTLTPAQFRAKEPVVSSSSSSILDGQKVPDVIGKEDTLPPVTAETPQALALLSSKRHVESILGEPQNIRQKSSLSLLATKLRLSPSSPNLPSSIFSSGPSIDTAGTTTAHPGDLSSERPISSVPTSRRQSMLISLPPPNLVLPTFSDIFDHPPRSTPPRPLLSQPVQDPTSNTNGRVKKRTIAKNVISSLTTYVYGPRSTNMTRDVDTNKGERTSTEGLDSQYLEDPESRGLPRTWVVQKGLKGGDEKGKALGIQCVKRVVVIGVHGWFPNAIVRYIAGEPTGTSATFAKKMVNMVEKYFGEGTLEKITAMPLEGEGKVEHRVDRLFKEYTSNPDWVDDLRSADAILVATHSQGCPVSTYLIERLYAQGHICSAFNQLAVEELKRQIGPAKEEQQNRKMPKVLMLGLCGVHLGPLAYLSSSSVVIPYLQYFENAAAHQLFEFQDTESATSKSYIQSLSNILDQGCKLVYVASLNDQVVPVYSAIFSVAHHPNILRVLHIDAVAYDTSDFVTKLLTFCLQLHNAGLSDGGLVTHLSEAVAAGLTGIGHSTAYGEDSTYLLAIRYLFETTSSPVSAGSLEVDEFLASEERNSYEIPWILRGIMEDSSVLRYFGRELDELRSSFDSWDPKTAKMKDLRRKLEPLRPRRSRRVNGRVESIPLLESNVPTAPPIPSAVESTDSLSVGVVQNSTNPLVSVSLNQDW
ncbi:hypothetical protein [Phaffia rhodozyma]|uniref:YMC020W-like alpha/beta hydrolase domain-containing protein n=1 Tax=Phaffia rhodozyma TaxID=264483 RepID=A0A0F7STS3_PHARH|nr:hypothetical protein [Phaffia rhodozyma]